MAGEKSAVLELIAVLILAVPLGAAGLVVAAAGTSSLRGGVDKLLVGCAKSKSDVTVLLLLLLRRLLLAVLILLSPNRLIRVGHPELPWMPLLIGAIHPWREIRAKVRILAMALRASYTTPARLPAAADRTM